MRPLNIAIIGFGKIAADQHVPSIAGNDRLELVATVSRSGAGTARRFTSYGEMLEQVEGLDAVALTTPPTARYDIARACLERGLHVLLEKPPTVTLAEIHDLACIAETEQRTLFTTWHARHNAAVEAAAKALAGKRIAAMEIVWHEDVRKWHPGQQWIWEPGGFGVFDPGINALSIATAIFPGPLFVSQAMLSFPQDAQTAVAAEIDFTSPVADGRLHCSFDFRRSKGEEWTITVRTFEGEELRLTDGGGRLLIDSAEQACEGLGEYPDIYRKFVQLIDERQSHVDVAPLRLVADCLLLGGRETVGPTPR
ncbi:MAG: Gfo/Idh/MocA family oxidoreductase [Pseudomonadota bacterium]|nr:Gfo/Idh/MocA family oxidoreductase [Sphingomonas sp.]MDQ3479167.1 Gfo/Idh/MocA family oxidoreductase [Pseudomonadota bacterium]